MNRPRANTVIVSTVGALAFLAFVLMAHYVRRGDIHALDSSILLSMRSEADATDPVGPAWVEELMRDITAFGGVGALTMITVGVAGYLVAIGRSRTAVLLLLSVTGGALLSFGLKEFFDRPRPDLVPHGSHVYTRSFPSGHSMLSAVTYLTLVAILTRVQPAWRARLYLIAAGTTLIALIGISRVYLGVHWPSDVIGGLALGVAWSTAAWLLERRLQRRGSIEPPPAGVAA